jgi:hypothetical protein
VLQVIKRQSVGHQSLPLYVPVAAAVMSWAAWESFQRTLRSVVCRGGGAFCFVFLFALVQDPMRYTY